MCFHQALESIIGVRRIDSIRFIRDIGRRLAMLARRKVVAAQIEKRCHLFGAARRRSLGPENKFDAAKKLR